MTQLQELEISKQLKRLRASDFVKLEDILTQHGWQLKGFGTEAVVAAHPSKPYVIKIFESGSVYSQFVDLVQHTPNPHFPVFNRFVRPIPAVPHFKYVRMEILQPVPSVTLERDYLPYLCVIQQTVDQVGQYHPSIFWNKIQKYNFGDVRSCAKKAPASWHKAIYQVVGAMPEVGVNQLDLHPGNMMLRGSTLVITDPWYK